MVPYKSNPQGYMAVPILGILVRTTLGMAITYTWERERIVFWHGSIEQVTMKDVEMKMGTPCLIAYTAKGEPIAGTKLA